MVKFMISKSINDYRIGISSDYPHCLIKKIFLMLTGGLGLVRLD